MLRATDRVLFLSPGDTQALITNGSALAEGMIAVCASDSALAELRKATAPLDNVMIHTHEPGEIPWRDGVFNVVIDPQRGWPMDPRALVEVARVLSPGGRWKDAPAEAHALLTQVGFTSEGSDLVKPAEPAAPPSLRVLG